MCCIIMILRYLVLFVILFKFELLVFVESFDEEFDLKIDKGEL